jgi:hypothetical protein
MGIKPKQEAEARKSLTSVKEMVLPEDQFWLAAVTRLRSGKFVSVSFIKKTTGLLRTIVGRTGVSKGVTGEGLKYDPADKGMIVMYELDPNTLNSKRKNERDKGFRMVTIDRITEFTADGITFRPEERGW